MDGRSVVTEWNTLSWVWNIAYPHYKSVLWWLIYCTYLWGDLWYQSFLLSDWISDVSSNAFMVSSCELNHHWRPCWMQSILSFMQVQIPSPTVMCIFPLFCCRHSLVYSVLSNIVIGAGRLVFLLKPKCCHESHVLFWAFRIRAVWLPYMELPIVNPR